MSDLATSLHALAQPLKSKVTQLTEKSLLYQHYGTLKKATSTEPGDTPGYVYDELVQLSYSDLIMATQLATYLADCLDSCVSKIRTTKTINHLVRKGSRQFRKTLRDKDDILRKAASFSDPLVAKITKDTRNTLFDEELMSKDESNSVEEIPQPALSGMGGSSGAQGFGNTPISKENLGHKVLDLIDKTVNVPDERAQVLKSCLENSAVGDYKPVQSVMMKSTFQQSTPMATSIFGGKKHTPGKAGGGWASSSSDEELEHELSQVSLTSSIKEPLKDSMIDSACEAIADDDVPEIHNLKEFCNQPGLPQLDDLNNCFNRHQDFDCLTVLEQLKIMIEDIKSPMKATRSMLLLECYLRTSKVKPQVYSDVFSNVLEKFHKNCDDQTASTKALKLSLIISMNNKKS